MADQTPEEIMVGKLADAIGELKVATRALEKDQAAHRKATKALEKGRVAAHRSIRRLVWAFVLLAVGVTVIGTQAVDLKSENGQRITDIQDQRATSVRGSCQDQNARHDQAIRALDRVLKKALQESPGRAAQIRQSRASTTLLIDALAPVENCADRVKRLVPNE